MVTQTSRTVLLGLLVVAHGVWGMSARPVSGADAVGASTKTELAEVEASAADPQHPAGKAAPGHAGHNSSDLSHANATPQLEDASEWRYDMSLCTFVVFLALMTLLGKFAWSPVMKGLDNREKFIARQIEEARQSAEQAAAELKAYRDKMASAAQEALEVVNQARKDAQAVAEKVHQEAQQVAARERERAITDIRAAKNAALREVARKGADLAVTLAGRIVRRELHTDDHTALITEALEQFPSSN